MLDTAENYKKLTSNIKTTSREFSSISAKYCRTTNSIENGKRSLRQTAIKPTEQKVLDTEFGMLAEEIKMRLKLIRKTTVL